LALNGLGYPNNIVLQNEPPLRLICLMMRDRTVIISIFPILIL
jgi:hypothetical protein